MVELIAVMVLIGILSATAYARLGGNEFDQAGYRDQVAATVAYARKAAIAQRRNVLVSLSGSTLSFRIANDIPEAAGGASFDGTAGRDLLLPGVGSAQIAPKGETALSGPATLMFSPLGIATAASYVYTFSGSPARTVTVDAASGHVY